MSTLSKNPNNGFDHLDLLNQEYNDQIFSPYATRAQEEESAAMMCINCSDRSLDDVDAEIDLFHESLLSD